MFIRGTTLIIPTLENHFGLQQVLSHNGGNRVPLPGNSLSQNRLRNQIAQPLRTGLHQPPALWNIGKEQIFHHSL